MRIISRWVRRCGRALFHFCILFCNFSDLSLSVAKIAQVIRREGVRGIIRRANSISSGQKSKQIIFYQGLSPKYVDALNFFARVFLSLESRWSASAVRRIILSRFTKLFQGKTRAAMDLAARANIHVFVDKPHWIITISKGPLVISGWACNLETFSAVPVRISVGKLMVQHAQTQRNDVRQSCGSIQLPSKLGFSTITPLPVGVHKIRIEGQTEDGNWILLHRTTALHLPQISRRVSSQNGRQSYQDWTALEGRLLKDELPEIERHIETMLHKPRFTIVIDARYASNNLQACIRSIRNQIYPFFELRILSGAKMKIECDLSRQQNGDIETVNDESLSNLPGDFVVFIQGAQTLSANALYEFSAAINQYPDADLIYADEDVITAEGFRSDPFYKPAWSPDYLEAFNYIGFPACFRTAIAQNCFGNGHFYDFVLRFTERTAKVINISKILGHSLKQPIVDAESATAVSLDISALQGRLQRTGRRGTIHEHALHKGCYDIRIDLKAFPLVSVIIPTAAMTITVGERRIDLIANIVNQIRNKSTYKNIEIIVIDNGNLADDQVEALTLAGCHRITYSDPNFNISKKLNLGASFATGEFLLIINDDIEILTPAWIERLLEHFEKPHVGVVGAKLLFPNGQIQHVGVVHNYGKPDHVRKMFPRNDAGYFFSTCAVHNYSAVTGACMMTPARLYRDVGGYSEQLAASFNDVDYCFKIREKGYWVVYAPSAELTHLESISRVASLELQELEWYNKQWAAELVFDTFYNEHFLTTAPPTFEPRINPRLL